MACALANSLGGGIITAKCSGTMPGDSINPRVVVAMNEIGLDLAANVPAVITQSQVDEADAVITMGCNVDECPINNFRVDADWQLDDPHLLSTDDVRRVRDEIRSKVVTLIQSFAERR